MWIVRTFLYWIALVVFTLIFSILALFASLLDHGGNSAHQCARAWAKTLLFFAGVKVRLEGEVNSLEPEGPYVFMANHQSAFDIFVLLAGLPVPFRWVAKAELFKIPIFGPAMKRAGYISINRDNPRNAVKSLNEAAQKIRDGVSVVVFPEGTRSKDGILLPFKSGGFVLAIKSQTPIVPTALIGTFDVKPVGRFWIHPNIVFIRFGTPVETMGLKTRDKEAMKNKIFVILQALLNQKQETNIT
jgi:1-acyl-sn-glycerol-3-phosphate acyltransferase